MERAASARFYDAEGNFLMEVRSTGPVTSFTALRDLVAALDIDMADVFAVNFDTRTIVTRAGQKHRLA